MKITKLIEPVAKPPVPLLVGKQSEYQGSVVFTANCIAPVAWACGECGKPYAVASQAVDCCVMSLHERKTGHYRPSRDPKGAQCAVLVAHSAGPGYPGSNPQVDTSDSHAEVLAWWGAAYDYAVDCDSGEAAFIVAQAVAAQPDGLYVVPFGYDGDDGPYAGDPRPMCDAEREYVGANSDFGQIIHAWLPAWNNVACAECKAVLLDHVLDSSGLHHVCPTEPKCPSDEQLPVVDCEHCMGTAVDDE